MTKAETSETIDYQMPASYTELLLDRQVREAREALEGAKKAQLADEGLEAMNAKIAEIEQKRAAYDKALKRQQETDKLVNVINSKDTAKSQEHHHITGSISAEFAFNLAQNNGLIPVVYTRNIPEYEDKPNTDGTKKYKIRDGKLVLKSDIRVLQTEDDFREEYKYEDLIPFIDIYLTNEKGLLNTLEKDFETITHDAIQTDIKLGVRHTTFSVGPQALMEQFAQKAKAEFLQKEFDSTPNSIESLKQFNPIAEEAGKKAWEDAKKAGLVAGLTDEKLDIAEKSIKKAAQKASLQASIEGFFENREGNVLKQANEKAEKAKQTAFDAIINGMNKAIKTAQDNPENDYTASIMVAVQRDNPDNLEKNKDSIPDFDNLSNDGKVVKNAAIEGKKLVDHMLAYNQKVAEKKLGYNELNAVGLDSKEAGCPIAEFKDTFNYARQKGCFIAPHAGEAGGPEEVENAFDFVTDKKFEDGQISKGSRLILHGNAIVHSPELLESAREANLVLAMSPWSNVYLNGCPDVRNHPIVKVIDADVMASVSCDDQWYFKKPGLEDGKTIAGDIAWNFNVLAKSGALNGSKEYSPLEVAGRILESSIIGSFMEEWSKVKCINSIRTQLHAFGKENPDWLERPETSTVISENMYKTQYQGDQPKLVSSVDQAIFEFKSMRNVPESALASAGAAVATSEIQAEGRI